MLKTRVAMALALAGGCIALALWGQARPERMTASFVAAAAAAEERLERAPDTETDGPTTPADGEAGAAERPLSTIIGNEDMEFEALDAAPATDAGGVPDVFWVKFECSNGDFVVEFRRDWAPRGVKRVYEIVRDGVWHDNRFFRVVPGFVVQWGIPGRPADAAEWRTKRIEDDPVRASNERGTFTFATSGPNARTTQVFINFRDNEALDTYQQGFPPVGKVVKGMDVVDAINAKYGEAPSQAQQAIQMEGNAFLDERFPGLDTIHKTVFVEPVE